MKQPEETKNGGARRIYANIIWIFLAVIVTAGCFASNLGGAWIGHPAKPAQFLMTAVYIIFWGMFAVVTRKHIVLIRISLAISLLTAIGAVAALSTMLVNFGLIFAVLLGAFTAVPFYGFRLLMNWTLLYGVVLAISLLWLIYSLRNLHVIRASR